MRDIRRGNCPICDHHEIIEAVAADFGHSDFERQKAVTYEPRWVLAGRNPKIAYGPIKMYVCRACGYVQQFADDPATIPIDGRYATRLVEGTRRDAPFR